ncbi:hypothetical protein D9M71_152550 [compost metagenome]
MEQLDIQAGFDVARLLIANKVDVLAPDQNLVAVKVHPVVARHDAIRLQQRLQVNGGRRTFEEGRVERGDLEGVRRQRFGGLGMQSHRRESQGNG